MYNNTMQTAYVGSLVTILILHGNAMMEIINLKLMAFAVSWWSLNFILMLMLMLMLVLLLKVEVMGKMNGFYGFHKLVFRHTVDISENRLLAKALVQCSPNSCIWQLSLLALLQLIWLDKHDASLFQLLWHGLRRRDQAQILHLTFSSLDTWHLAASSPPFHPAGNHRQLEMKRRPCAQPLNRFIDQYEMYAKLRSTGWEFQCLVVQLVIPSTPLFYISLFFGW